MTTLETIIQELNRQQYDESQDFTILSNTSSCLYVIGNLNFIELAEAIDDNIKKEFKRMISEKRKISS